MGRGGCPGRSVPAAVTVHIRPSGQGYLLCKGGVVLRSPGGAAVRVPVERLATALVREMTGAGPLPAAGAGPIGHLTVLALDRVCPDREAFLGDILSYGNADLLVHRAGSPPELVRRQAANWDPIMQWAADALGAELQSGVGVRPIDQAESALSALEAAVREELSRASSQDFALAALGELTVLSGSLVLALAVARQRLPATEAWSASMVDEDWQSEQWGADSEAVAAQDRRRKAFLVAAELLPYL